MLWRTAGCEDVTTAQVQALIDNILDDCEEIIDSYKGLKAFLTGMRKGESWAESVIGYQSYVRQEGSGDFFTLSTRVGGQMLLLEKWDGEGEIQDVAIATDLTPPKPVDATVEARLRARIEELEGIVDAVTTAYSGHITDEQVARYPLAAKIYVDLKGEWGDLDWMRDEGTPFPFTELDDTREKRGALRELLRKVEKADSYTEEHTLLVELAQKMLNPPKYR